MRFFLILVCVLIVYVLFFMWMRTRLVPTMERAFAPDKGITAEGYFNR